MSRPWTLPALIIGFWLLWAAGVLAHGDGVDWLGLMGLDDLEFSRAAQFGDAFGSLSSLMATLAAAGALYTVSQSRIQSFEITFYSFLAHLNQIIAMTDIQGKKKSVDADGIITIVNTDKFVGRDSYKRLLSTCRATISAMKNESEIENVILGYKRFHEKYSNDLAHYFRTIYHIVRYIDESPIRDKYLYARILRAQLSDSEQTLLMYNCSVGRGEEKFKNLVEKYSLLHNCSRNRNKNHWENKILRRSFKKMAFRDDNVEQLPTADKLLKHIDEAHGSSEGKYGS